MNGFSEELPITSYNSYKSKMTINDFSMICVLGKGSYAEVILARKKDSNEIYALKILKKKKIEQKNQNTNVKNERNILVTYSFAF
jgi:serum/glucocorticoid-regulated kinase 2